MKPRIHLSASILACLLLAGCGGGSDPEARQRNLEAQRENITAPGFQADRESIFDLFNRPDTNRELNVNKYLWVASLDILSFLPVEAVDPFSGVISTGWGRAAGASQAYRATVYVTGPALDARSLRVAVFRQSGGGAVAVGDPVAEQIEDAILTRARQLRVEADRRG